MSGPRGEVPGLGSVLARLAGLPETPPLHAAGTHVLWTDPHVATGMLRAHLDPLRDAASRRHAVIDASVAWIASALPTRARVLDLGCGPGLYARRLSERGFDLTGVDISATSLDYARLHSPTVRYLLGDYRHLPLGETFDAVLLIYLDLGTFSPADTRAILDRVRAWLAPGGYLFVDVATRRRREGSERRRDWGTGTTGFWADEPHLWTTRTLRYDRGPTYLDEHLVITAADLRHFRVWERCYAVDDFVALLTEAGLTVDAVHADLTGRPFDGARSPEIAVAARRP